jgi:hypothetical protein
VAQEQLLEGGRLGRERPDPGLHELAFLWVMVSGVIIIARNQGWNGFAVALASGVGALLILGVLRLCMPKPGELMDEIH